jgi:VWFA-related protein
MRPVRLFLFAAVCCSAAAQQLQTVPTFQATARTVQLDVVVTGAKGQPLTGLKRSDFTLLDNGRPQALTYFEEHVPGPQPRLNPAEKSFQLPPGTYTNFPFAPPSDSVNVLLVDALNTSTVDQAYLREQLIKYVRSMKPGTQVAVFILGDRLRLLQGFTDDPAALLGAINDKKNGFVPMQAVRPGDYDIRVRITLQSLDQISRFLSAVPGRKNLIWFSGNFPLTINAGGTLNASDFLGDFANELQQATNLMLLGQVAIYPVDARGLAGLPMYNVANAGRGPDIAHSEGGFYRNLIAAHEGMNTIAQQTGGVAIYNSNDLRDAIERVTQNGSHFYTLAYNPSDEKWNGTYHNIKVALTRAGYRLQYRQGYYARENTRPDAQPTAGPSQDPFLTALSHGMPNTSQVVYELKIAPEPGRAPSTGNPPELKGPLTAYKLDYAVMLNTLHLALTPDGVHHGSVSFAALAFDSDGNLLNVVRHDYAIELPQATYTLFGKIGLQFTSYIDLPRRGLFLRTGVEDLSAERWGSLEFPLEVPAR